MAADDANRLRKEGTLLLAEEDFRGAARKFSKALSSGRTAADLLPNTWSDLALCYDKLGELDKFLDAAKKCVAADPTFTRGYIHLVRAYQRLWRFDDAREAIRAGLEEDSRTRTDTSWFGGRRSEDIECLKKMMSRVDEKIRDRALYREDLLTVPTERPILFGGVDIESENPRLFKQIQERRANGSAYFNMAERSLLPPLCKKHRDLSDYAPGVRPVVKALYTGNLLVKWRVVAQAAGTLLTIEAYIPGDTVPFLMYTHIVSEQQRMGRYFDSIPEDPKYEALPLDEKDWASLIIMQRFLRQKGCEAAGLLSENACYRMIDTISGHCIQMKLYKDACDFRLLLADISIAAGFDWIDTHVIYLAENLEAAKKNKLAAAIYSELASNDSIFDGAGRRGGQSLIHGYAGLAYKRAGDYVNSEAQYIAAIRFEGKEWEFTDPAENNASNSLRNLLFMYDAVCQGYGCGLLTSDEDVHLMKVGCVVFALLGRAKIIRVSGGSFRDMAISTVRTWKMLKPKFAKERNALNAFLDACAKPDIDSYQMTLLSYLKREDITFPMLTGKQKKAAQKDFISSNQWASKTVAREHLDNGNFVLFDSRIGCANCNKMEDKNERFMVCPCKTVKYCCKTCQREDWNKHKNMCPLRKKK